MEKSIYGYFNGKEQVKADPHMIELRFNRAARRIDYETTLRDFQGPEWFGDPEKIKAMGIPDAAVAMACDRKDDAVLALCGVICEAFGVKTIEQDAENGLNLWTIIGLWDAFLSWSYDVKKNTDQNASSPPPVESYPSSTITSDSSDTSGTPI